MFPEPTSHKCFWSNSLMILVRFSNFPILSVFRSQSFHISYIFSGHLTDVEIAKRGQKTFVEFVKLFYFIKWDKLLLPDNEFMLKEVYEMWEDFQKKRHRVCDEHYMDFTFRFFTSS